MSAIAPIVVDPRALAAAGLLVFALGILAGALFFGADDVLPVGRWPSREPHRHD